MLFIKKTPEQVLFCLKFLKFFPFSMIRRNYFCLENLVFSGKYKKLSLLGKFIYLALLFEKFCLDKQNQQSSCVRKIFLLVAQSAVILEITLFYGLISIYLSKSLRGFFILLIDQQSSRNVERTFLEKYQKFLFFRLCMFPSEI